jgi:hypothetical protein
MEPGIEREEANDIEEGRALGNAMVVFVLMVGADELPALAKTTLFKK